MPHKYGDELEYEALDGLNEATAVTCSLIADTADELSTE